MHEGDAVIEEVSREGATRVYKARVSVERVQDLVNARLGERARTIRLPGFRAGKIPRTVMEQRYGAAARAEIANRLGAQTADRIFADGGLASGVELVSGATSGDLEFRITVTHLPDLPEIDFTNIALERLTASNARIVEAGLTAETAREVFEDHLRRQILDYLDLTYSFTLAQPLIEREYRVLAAAAGAPDVADELHVVAERRVRLGAVVTELARRHGIDAAKGEQLEEKVIAWIVSHAVVSERMVTPDELREMAA